MLDVVNPSGLAETRELLDLGQIVARLRSRARIRNVAIVDKLGKIAVLHAILGPHILMLVRVVGPAGCLQNYWYW